jgi:hypothetical protein
VIPVTQGSNLGRALRYALRFQGTEQILQLQSRFTREGRSEEVWIFRDEWGRPEVTEHPLLFCGG